MNLFLHLKKNSRVYLFIFLFLLSLFTTFLYVTAGQKNWDKSLVLLSEQFLKGKISLPINEYLPIGDIADYKYNFYVYFGPLPSILLMPAVAVFGKEFPQYFIGVFSLTVSFIVVYLLSRKFKFDKLDSLWLSLFFVFSSVLFSSSVMNISAYQVEALGVPLILFAIYEYFSRKRPILIGLFLAFAVLTRFTLMFSIVFFVIEFFKKRLSLKQLALILIPFLLSILLLGLYNQRRFHSFFETGYSYNRILGAFPLSENLKHGTVSVSHVPANLYNFLIKSPDPLLGQKHGFFLKFPYLIANPWGMAIWWTSPLFLMLIIKFKKNKYTLPAILTTFALAIPVFTYYSIGFVQFGYRYALDFFPFLFLLLIPSLSPKLSKTAIALIVVGVLFNLIYSDSIFGIYPLLNMF
ncbi:MAG: hypothetical protein WD992_03665 [Candidatus Levyibacteriota bacterium]